MKNLVATLAILVTTIVFAQQPITKSIGEFTTLKVYDLINVEMIKSNENRVEITGKNAQDVVVVNKNGKLKIKMRLEESYDGNDTEVKLYFTSVDIIDANEGAFIASNDTFQQYEIELKAQEGGHIKLNIETSETEIRAYTGGIVELSGQSKHQNIKLNTGGNFQGKHLKAERTDVSIKAGGEADVIATEVLDIRITAGGDVFIYNEPKVVNKKRALGGRIKYMN